MLIVRRPITRRIHAWTLTRLGYGNDNLATNGEANLINDLPPTPVVFDVGAHHGDYAAAVLERRPNATVHCFEPSAVSCIALKERLEGRATLHNFALADRQVTAPVYADYQGSVGTSLYRRELGPLGIEMNQTETVKVSTLDAVCGERQVDHIDLLKIDAEGAEASVIEGGRNMISRGSIDRIMFEYGGTALDSHRFIRDFYLLLEDRYELFRVVSNGLLPLGPYQAFYEFAHYQNICALRKTII